MLFRSNFVQAFGRTGGEHHPVLPKTEEVPDQIVRFRGSEEHTSELQSLREEATNTGNGKDVGNMPKRQS